MNSASQWMVIVTLQFAATLASTTAYSQAVTSDSLVNADTDQIVQTLLDGSTIDVAVLGTRNLNVIANTSPTVVGSVRFGLDGNLTYRIENSPPYTLAGDGGGDFYPWKPSLGTHVVKATPYSGARATGTAGSTVQASFTLVDTSLAKVESFLLVNADTDQPLATLTDGQSINLATLGTRHLNIAAVTSPATVGSVLFEFDGESDCTVDSSLPYAFASEVDGDYAPWTPALGSHILSATPYSGPDGSGIKGIPREVQFTVVDIPPTPVFPGTYWASKTPAALGLDSTKLAAFKAYVGGRGMVVRYGYKAYAWGDIAARLDFASATKPVHTHMLLNAVQSGTLGGLDSPVAQFEPRLNFINSALGYKDRGITWRDLANMTSGYGLTEPPGTAFAYNDYAIALYVDALMLKVYGVTWSTADSQVLQPLLGNRIGWQDRPTYNGKTAGRIAISTRDLARFGLLYLNLGNWKGSQLLDAELVSLATQSPLSNSLPRTSAIDAEMIADQRTLGGGKDQSDHNGSYSYTWWANGVMRDGTRYWPALPLDAYVAHGNWGKRVLLVVPSLQLVVVWTDASRVDTIPELREAFRLLREALL